MLLVLTESNEYLVITYFKTLKLVYLGFLIVNKKNLFFDVYYQGSLAFLSSVNMSQVSKHAGNGLLAQ